MREPRLSVAIASVVVCLFIAACSAGPSGRLLAAERALAATIRDRAEAEVPLSELVPGDWDLAYVFAPCEFPNRIRAALGFDWSGAETIENTAYCGDIDLVRYLIVIVSSDQVYGWLLVNGDRDGPQAVVRVDEPIVLSNRAVLRITYVGGSPQIDALVP